MSKKIEKEKEMEKDRLFSFLFLLVSNKLYKVIVGDCTGWESD
jgi:hypothetical protein